MVSTRSSGQLDVAEHPTFGAVDFRRLVIIVRDRDQAGARADTSDVQCQTSISTIVNQGVERLAGIVEIECPSAWFRNAHQADVGERRCSTSRRPRSTE